MHYPGRYPAEYGPYMMPGAMQPGAMGFYPVGYAIMPPPEMMQGRQPSAPSTGDEATVVPVTVMFADLRGFTSLVEAYPPNQVVQQLNEYFTCMSRILVNHGATVDKYMGDEIMAYFEASNPLEYTMMAQNAVKAGITMINALKHLNSVWEGRGWPTLSCGIGLNSGPVLKGRIGSTVKHDTTIIGDTVNVASRLQHLNKEYDAPLIISQATAKLVHNTVELKELGDIQLRGKKQSLRIYAWQGSTEKPVEPELKPDLPTDAWVSSLLGL